MNKFEYLLEKAAIVKETEKAVQINVEVGDDRRANVWFPKSQMNITGIEIWVTAWILEQKEREICGSNEGGITVGWYPEGRTLQHN